MNSTVQLAYDPTHRVLLFQFAGHISDQVFREWSEALPRQVIGLDISAWISDMTGVTMFELRPETMHAFAGRPPRLGGTHCRSVIVAPNPHVFGLSRAYQMIADQTRPQLEVVRTMEDALELLGNVDAKFGPLPAATTSVPPAMGPEPRPASTAAPRARPRPKKKVIPRRKKLGAASRKPARRRQRAMRRKK